MLVSWPPAWPDRAPSQAAQARDRPATAEIQETTRAGPLIGQTRHQQPSHWSDPGHVSGQNNLE